MIEWVRQLISARKVGIALGVLLCAAAAIYALWYASAGKFPVFPTIPNDYIDLGQAFLHGQVSLLEQPDPRLANFQPPYKIKLLKNIPYRFDASYYQGKYYLYWGPVPGVVAATLQGITHVVPTGSLLLVLPYIGLLVIFLAILIQISKYFSGRAASLSLGLFVLLGFINVPLLFLLGEPRSYEAAILYGQFFLLLGLLSWVNYLTTRKSPWLVAAGLNWGLAFGCRYNLGISAAVYMAFALIWLGREAGWNQLWKKAGPLVVPLALCFIGLGVYNFVRFGNPLEVGLKYQLTIDQFRGINYSISYFPSSLYIYLLYPLTAANGFPFIQPTSYHPFLLPNWLTIPPGRDFEQGMLGLFPSVPAIWLSALAIPFFILAIRSAVKHQAHPQENFQRNFFFAMIGSAVAGQFLFLMVFFFGAERYILDFYLPLILLLAMLVWQTDESLSRIRLLRFALWLVAAGLTLWTVGIGFFGCFGLPTLISPYYDPALIARLASYWNAHYAGLHSLLH